MNGLTPLKFEEPVNLTGQVLSDAYLNSCDLTGAVLDHALLTKAELTECTLDDATLVGADLTRCEIDNSSLRYSRLSRAWLGAASFSNVDLTGSSFDGCQLASTWFAGAIFDEVTGTGSQGTIRGAPDTAPARVGGRDLTLDQFVDLWQSYPQAVVHRAIPGDPDDAERATAVWATRQSFLDAVWDEAEARERGDH